MSICLKQLHLKYIYLNDSLPNNNLHQLDIKNCIKNKFLLKTKLKLYLITLLHNYLLFRNITRQTFTNN